MKVIIFGGSRGVGKAIVQRLESEFEMRASEFITIISRTAGNWPYEPFDDDKKYDVFIFLCWVGYFFKYGDVGVNVDEMLELNLSDPIFYAH